MMNFTGNSSNGSIGDTQNNMTNMLEGPVPVWIQTLYFIYVGLIFAFGVPGNFIIVLVYAKADTKKACDWFILFIGVTDFLVCIVSPLLCVHTELAIKIPYINSILCGIEHVWQLAGMTASCFILTLLSIERYIRVCHLTVKPLTPITTRNISIACLVLGTAISVYPALPQFQRETCAHMGSVEIATKITIFIYFAIFLVCLVTVVFTYVSVIRSLEKHTKLKQRLLNNSGLHTEPDYFNNGRNHYEDRSFVGAATDDKEDLIELHEIHPTPDNSNSKRHGHRTSDTVTVNNGGAENLINNHEKPSFLGNTANPGNGDIITTSTSSKSPFCVESSCAKNSVIDNEHDEGTHLLGEPNTGNVNEGGSVSGVGNPIPNSETKTADNDAIGDRLMVHKESLTPSAYTRDENHEDFLQKAKKAMSDFQEKIVNTKKRSETGKRLIRERQVTLMLVCVTAVFLCTWLPAWILYLLAVQRISLFPSGVPTRIAYRYFDKIFLLNYISNFPIYYRYNATFRTRAKAVIPRWARKYCMCCCLRNLDKETFV